MAGAEANSFGIVAPRLVELGYLPVPIRSGTKRPAPDRWPDFRVDEAALAKYWRRGTGLLCGTQVGLDIDVLDEVAAEELYDLAQARLGRGPSRSAWPRRC